MKFTLSKFTFFIFSVPFLLYAGNYNSTGLNNINPTFTLAETFYDKLEVKENLPKLTNIFIDKKAKKRTSVPSTLWDEVKNNIDYDYFKQDVLSIIPDYYEDSELQELIDLHVDKPHIPITKYQFKNELYNLLADFGDNKVLGDINNMLTNNGYEPFN